MTLLRIEAPSKKQAVVTVLPKVHFLGNGEQPNMPVRVLEDALPGMLEVAPGPGAPAAVTTPDTTPTSVVGTASSKANWSWTIATFGVVALGAVVGSLVPHASFTAKAGIDLFAVYYILAQTLERITEVTTYLIPHIGAAIAVKKSGLNGNAKTEVKVKTKQQAIDNRDTAIKKAENHLDEGKTDEAQSAANTAASEQEAVNNIRDDRTLFLWGFNVMLATIGSGLLGLALLSTIGVTNVNSIVDYIVTGIAVGSGTKPLHDLISNIQKSKENKEDATKET
jgi:hypothetical protein